MMTSSFQKTIVLLLAFCLGICLKVQAKTSYELDG
jgi:hypothetical protein